MTGRSTGRNVYAMRFRTSVGALCAAVLCLASAGTVLAGSGGSSASGAVRLLLGRSVFRAGQNVSVSIVNSGRSVILRGFCFKLAREFGTRWVTVTRTHGVPVPCATKAGVPQPSGTRQPLGLPLYDDLVPGHYRITLRYKPVSGSGTNLGNLTGPRVRSVSAMLTVLAFKPGPQPHLSGSRILKLAEQAAARSGDPSPSLIQHVEATRFDAVRISSGDLVFEWNWAYLIAERGHFTCSACSGPSRAKAPTGSVITLVVDAKSGQGTDGGIGNRYPPLAKLGRVTTDLRSMP